MAEITNTPLLQDLQKVAQLRASDIGKFKLSKTIVPCLETNPHSTRTSDICKYADRNTTGTATIFTTLSDSDFYVTSATLSFIKDAACDGATGAIAYVYGTVNGATAFFIRIPGITLTAQSATVAITFKSPIKLDKGTVVAIGGAAYAAGVMCRTATVNGYYA